jgi:hypothetical protein
VFRKNGTASPVSASICAAVERDGVRQLVDDEQLIARGYDDAFRQFRALQPLTGDLRQPPASRELR